MREKSMDTFEVLITPDAMDMLTNLSDYILFNKQNPDAADDVYQDALETANQLQTVAGSLGFCKRKILADHGYRKICLQRHDYVLLYKIYSNTAVVEAVFHQKEDYENKFVHSLNIKKKV